MGQGNQGDDGYDEDARQIAGLPELLPLCYPARLVHRPTSLALVSYVALPAVSMWLWLSTSESLVGSVISMPKLYPLSGLDRSWASEGVPWAITGAPR